MGIHLKEFAKRPMNVVISGTSILGFLVAFIGNAISPSKASPLSWFSLIYILLTAAFIIAVLITDSLRNYHTPVIAYIAIGFVFTVLVIQDQAGDRKDNIITLVGYSVLCLSLFVALIYLSPVPEDYEETSADSLAQSKTTMPSKNDLSSRQSNHQRPIGLEPGYSSTDPNGSINIPFTSTLLHGEIAQDYKYQAKAQYSYEAQDPNELSFNKGDTLDIADKDGKWWPAKDSDGNTGIVPSNYLQLI